MAGKLSSGVVFWGGLVAVAAVVGAVIFLNNGGSIGGFTSVPRMAGAPRTAEPVGQYTRFFEKKSADVRSGVVQLNMTYHWYAPQKPWPPGIKFPMVIILHGAPGNAYAAQYMLSRDMLLNFPAFIFIPVLPPGMTWYSAASTLEGVPADKERPKGLPGAMTIAKQLMQEYPVDASRVYVLGCSEGGVGAFGAVKEYSDMLAGAVSLFGGWHPADAPKFLRTPMLVMHGGADTVIPVETSRNVSRAVQKLGGPLQYVEFPGMEHNCPAPNLYGAPTWKWLFSQKKNMTAPSVPPVPSAPK